MKKLWRKIKFAFTGNWDYILGDNPPPNHYFLIKYVYKKWGFWHYKKELKLYTPVDENGFAEGEIAMVTGIDDRNLPIVKFNPKLK